MILIGEALTPPRQVPCSPMIWLSFPPAQLGGRHQVRLICKYLGIFLSDLEGYLPS
jgi:hypothetical protein